MLVLKGVRKVYQMGDTTVNALKGIDLTIEEGDFVAIMGPSGSGKSTLMHVLGLLDVPDSGSYTINGKEVSQRTEDELAALRRKVIGFIFQQFNLLPRISALENVSLPLLYSEGKLDLMRANELLQKTGLGSRVHHHSNEMSGGQQQRVAIARSLINKPQIIFADEPTGNLDSVSEKEIMGILKELNDSGITIILVTHEEEVASQAKRLIRMRDGVIQTDERRGLPSPNLQPKVTEDKERPQGFSFANVTQHWREGIKTLNSNKVRTWLSILGIMIGVAAVVAMLALGRGAQKAIEEQLATLGSNLLVVQSGAVRGAGGAMVDGGASTKLSSEDGEMIKKQIPYVKAVASNINGRGQATYLNKNWSTTVIGVSPAYAKMHTYVPVVGRFFTDEENQRRTRIAAIGITLVKELFGGKNPIGETIKINKVGFRVIGVLPEKGANAFQNQDDKILIPLNTAMRRLMGRDYVDFIDVEVDAPEHIEIVQNKALELMLNRHKIPLSQRQDAFKIMNLADIQKTLTASTKIMTALLALIAAISLLVGGIGIMNIMLVSVTERTREIGLRKAIGAERKDILTQFLIEAIVISLVGGIAGVFLAWLMTVILSLVAGFDTYISLGSVLVAFIFSASIGVIFGIYPAKKASRLAPIDALRFE